MALQIVYADGAGVTHSEAYARIDKFIVDNPASGKTTASMDVMIYHDKAARDSGKAPVWGPQGYTFEVENAGAAVIADGYAYLKTQEQFEGGQDV